MTTPSSNPVPSKDPRDLLFNAEKLDEAVNSAALKYMDRLGVSKLTLAGAAEAIKAFNYRGAWVTATTYALKDVVVVSGIAYVCSVAHTSSASFATDLASKWVVHQGVTVDGLPDLAQRSFADTASIQAAIKAQSYKVGQKFNSNLYGGSLWVVKSAVVLQDGAESTINYDDELHLVVNLQGGGTAIAECQSSSVSEYAQQLYTQSYTQAFALMRQTAQSTTVQVDCYGDSITFGQYDGQPGAIATTGTATGYGDGSTHTHDRHPSPWPSVLQGCLQEVYGAGVTVVNRGYSGDRVGSGYNRHRVGAGGKICFIGYGTNDVLYGTTNGTNPGGLFNEGSSYPLSKFVPALRKFVLRQMLRGSVPVLLAPYVFSSVTGYDGTNFAAAKMLDYYRAAIFALGAELGVLVVDLNDIIGNLTLTVLFDGVHPATGAHNAIGRRLAAPLIGRGFHCPEVIFGERRIGASVLTDSMDGRGAVELVNTSNGQTFGKPFYSLTEGQDLVIGNSGVWWSFYLAEDAKMVMPVGYLAASSSLTYSLDFESTDGQSEKLRVDPLGVKGAFLTNPSFKTLTSTAVRDINHPAVIAQHVVICGKGWHSVKLIATAGSFVASGLRFWDEQTAWQPLALQSGMGAVGDIAPAWAVKDGTLLFRGIVQSPTPSSRLKVFNLPSEVASLMPGNLTTTSVALPWSRVLVSIDTGAIYWDANVGHSTNLLNLDNIRIPLVALPTP